MFRFILMLFCTIYYFSAKSQYIEFGGSLGGSSYQGDISHYSSKFSLQGNKFLNSIHVGYHFSDYYSIKVRYSHGSLGANDKESHDIWRKERNLHFKTYISEIAIINEFEMLDVFRFFKKTRLKPFINIGIAYFKFNPQAQLNGTWYDLQPLSTEGQGLEGNKNKPYSLNQFSIPFGLGLKYFVKDDLYFSFEVSPRITFTDYLDDVSANYPDIEKLKQVKGNIAAELSYQGDKRPGGLPFKELGGNARGNPKDNDWYIFNSFSVAYFFHVDDYMKRRRSFRLGRKCNFFLMPKYLP
ncbi:MAG: hypothetical protein IPO92_12455 [Saprospiraceae bacterium]|nr:hypothetical protein [Saprospiraceae bacterium]